MSSPMEQIPLGLAPAPEPTLDNYVPGRNAAALAALRDAATGHAATTVLYLWGVPGSGRTHLVRAASAVGLAAVDDVETLDAAAQIALFDAINEARAAGAAVVVAGSASPAQLTLREDLRTRLGSGLAFELAPLSDAEKADALRARAAALGMKLPEDVLAWLQTHLARDLGTQIAVLDALDRYSLAHQRPLTLPLVRAALRTDNPPP
jgi:DnaA family protein